MVRPVSRTFTVFTPSPSLGFAFRCVYTSRMTTRQGFALRRSTIFTLTPRDQSTRLLQWTKFEHFRVADLARKPSSLLEVLRLPIRWRLLEIFNEHERLSPIQIVHLRLASDIETMRSKSHRDQ
jgi:hypothetical protein